MSRRDAMTAAVAVLAVATWLSWTLGLSDAAARALVGFALSAGLSAAGV